MITFRSAASEVTGVALIFLRDRERDIGTGYKTRVALNNGRWDDEPWRTGAYACDCVRGHILYVGGRYACGTTRFVVEQVVDCESGEAWPVAPAAERARRIPAEPHSPAD